MVWRRSGLSGASQEWAEDLRREMQGLRRSKVRRAPSHPNKHRGLQSEKISNNGFRPVKRSICVIYVKLGIKVLLIFFRTNLRVCLLTHSIITGRPPPLFPLRPSGKGSWRYHNQAIKMLKCGHPLPPRRQGWWPSFSPFKITEWVWVRAFDEAVCASSVWMDEIDPDFLFSFCYKREYNPFIYPPPQSSGPFKCVRVDTNLWTKWKPVALKKTSQ